MKSYLRNYPRLAVTLLLAVANAFCQTGQPQGPDSGSPSDRQQLFGPSAPDLQDIGKNMVIGHLQAIENTKLTISRPDGVEQLVIVDASTKFFGEHGNAVTLAEFKTGEQVAVIGTLENGELVGTKLLKVSPGPNTPPLHSCGLTFRYDLAQLSGSEDPQRCAREIWRGAENWP